MILKRVLKTIKRKGWRKSSPTHKNHTKSNKAHERQFPKNWEIFRVFIFGGGAGKQDEFTKDIQTYAR